MSYYLVPIREDVRHILFDDEQVPYCKVPIFFCELKLLRHYLGQKSSSTFVSSLLLDVATPFPFPPLISHISLFISHCYNQPTNSNDLADLVDERARFIRRVALIEQQLGWWSLSFCLEAVEGISILSASGKVSTIKAKKAQVRFPPSVLSCLVSRGAITKLGSFDLFCQKSLFGGPK